MTNPHERTLFFLRNFIQITSVGDAKSSQMSPSYRIFSSSQQNIFPRILGNYVFCWLPWEVPVMVLYLFTTCEPTRIFPFLCLVLSTQFLHASNSGPDFIGVVCGKNVTMIIRVQYKPMRSKNVCFHLLNKHVMVSRHCVRYRKVLEFLVLERLQSRRKEWKQHMCVSKRERSC